MHFRIITDLAEARRTILRRKPPGELVLPEAVRAVNRALFGEDLSAEQIVERIVARVRAEGDAALRHFSEVYDRVVPESFEVSPEEVAAARGKVPPPVLAAMELAAERVRRFHEKSVPRSWMDFEDGGAMGQIFRPIERVGIHIPGWSAPLPSSLLMAAIPARVAGVREIVLVSPPRGSQISPLTLAAASVAGVDRVFRVGGAQAIAALAYGTESIPRVDKVLGPGNIFATFAKKRVFGDVGIDQLAGPTETLIVADETARASEVAADLLAQAEHEPLASAILIATSEPLARKVADELARQVAALPRREIATESIGRNGGAVVAPDVETALELANEYAPEHLCLMLADGWSAVPNVRNAGGIFVGAHSFEVLGDYTAGPSHIMPTNGTARFSSPLNVLDFLKVTSLFALSPAQVAAIGPAAMALAEAEGLGAHAAAVRHRLEELQDGR